MHRVNRSAPWKEQARAGLAPDCSVRKCQKGVSGCLSLRSTLQSSQSSFALLSDEIDLLDEIGEHVVAELLGRVAPSLEPSATDALRYGRLIENRKHCWRTAGRISRWEVLLVPRCFPADNHEPRQRFGHCGPVRQLDAVIEDDGFIGDSLLLNAKVCAVPRADMLDAVVPPPPDSSRANARSAPPGASRSGARAALR